ncbi:MAG: hypothetical protein ACJATA_001491 [Sphingobacteriales bacterium]
MELGNPSQMAQINLFNSENVLPLGHWAENQLLPNENFVIRLDGSSDLTSGLLFILVQAKSKKTSLEEKSPFQKQTTNKFNPKKKPQRFIFSLKTVY